MISSIIFQGSLIVLWPYFTASDNWMAIFNEVCVSIYLYISYLLTDWTVDIAVKSSIGNILGGFISFVLIINMTRAFNRIYQTAKQFYLTHKHILKKVSTTVPI
jgi:hypothetical protein